jgi:outer membrane protein assembly factor BamE
MKTIVYHTPETRYNGALIAINKEFPMRRIIAGLLIVLVSVGFTACVYRPDVQQGNIITDADLQGLHIGMTQDEVRSLFGDPLLVDIYDENRMIYIYTFKHRYQKMQETRLIIYLRSGHVSKFWTDHLPLPTSSNTLTPP